MADQKETTGVTIEVPEAPAKPAKADKAPAKEKPAAPEVKAEAPKPKAAPRRKVVNKKALFKSFLPSD